jgi:NADPH-dependent 2,4-dienoyl-CoA reductase/sulfur reductase-like enzyme
MRRYVILGSGAAGVAAAESIRRLDASGSIWVVTADPHGYYSRPGLAYYLTGEAAREQLFPFPNRHWKDLDLRWHVEPVESIDPAGHRLILHSGKSLPYDRLLVATGAKATLPDTPGIGLNGVVKLDTLEDAEQIIKLSRRGQHAVVVGGGITALELAEGLAARGMRVHYFLRGDRFWSGVLDETESRLVEKRLQHDGIFLHFNTNLLEVLGRGGKVTGVRAKAGEDVCEMTCSVVAVAIGIRPRKELAEQAGLLVGRGVRVNQCLQTSHPDIFAAGDVAEVIDPRSGEYILDSLWNPAIEMGTAAGRGMAGRMTPYQKLVPFNVTRLGGLITTIIGQIAAKPDALLVDHDLPGIMRGDSEIWRQHPDAVVTQRLLDGSRLRLYLSGGRMVGGLVMGEQRLSRPVQHLVRSAVDLGDLAPRLLSPGARLDELLWDFIG